MVTGMVLLVGKLLAQDYQTNYTFGKELFREGRYELASQSFKKVMVPAPDNPFAAYASFYNALCVYKQGQIGNSRSLFMELTQRFASWDKIDEAYYWLAMGYFDEGKVSAALDYLAKINTPGLTEDVRLLKTERLSRIDTVARLRALHEAYPQDTVVAKFLARAIVASEYNLQDQATLREIVDRFDFNEEEFGLADLSKSVKKSEYHVAVMFPFMFTSLADSRANLRTDFVTELYLGMKQGVEKLRMEGKKVVLHAYDTKRSGPATSALLRKEELKKMDLIIGPLYPEPSRLVSEFSATHKINMINPVSANPEVIGSNPFSFLMRSSYLTQALKAADYAAEHLDNNKNALVFYENNPRDSAAASLYSQRLREHEFQVLKLKALRPSEAHYLIDTLSFKKEVEIGSKVRLDSMLLKPEKYIVKSRQKTFGKDSLVYYEEVWGIKRDSIGHIMVASSSPLFATNTISAVEIRPDTIPVIGREEWLEIPQVNFDQVQRIQAVFISPMYVDKRQPAYQDFQRVYLSKYKTTPSQYAAIGYELAVVFGRLMHANGNYFQAGMQEGQRAEGLLTPGFKYGFYNDNQVVTFLRLDDSELVTEVK